MIDTKAVRALAERMTDWSYDERKGDGMLARNVGEALFQVARAVGQVRRQHLDPGVREQRRRQADRGTGGAHDPCAAPGQRQRQRPFASTDAAPDPLGQRGTDAERQWHHQELEAGRDAVVNFVLNGVKLGRYEGKGTPALKGPPESGPALNQRCCAGERHRNGA
jgi:hypothetical protein